MKDITAAYFERPHRIAAYPSARMPLLNLHAQQFINQSSRASCHGSWGLNIIHVCFFCFFLTSICRSRLPSLRVTQSLWCTTRLWQVEQSWDGTQTFLSIMLICKKDACIPTWRYQLPIHHVIPSQLFWHLMPCIVGLCMLYLATETSPVDLKDDLYQAFASLLIISPPYNPIIYNVNHFIRHFIKW